MSYPGRRILQDVGFQLLHEHLVIEDNDGVIVALSDQHMLEGLQHTVTTKNQLIRISTQCVIRPYRQLIKIKSRHLLVGVGHVLVCRDNGLEA